MPYYRNIPGAAQRISASQPQLQTNTNTVDNAFNQDHIHHSENEQGKHADVHFNHFTAEPAANTVATDIEIYNALYAITGNPELFVRKGIAANGTPFTAKNGGFDWAVLGASSWSYLPSGALIKCGKVTVTFPLGIDIPFNTVGEPTFTTAPFIFCSISEAVPHGWRLYTTGVTAARFTIIIDNATAATNATWLAIGI